MADKYMLDRPESKVGVCKSIRDDIQNVLGVIAEAKQDKNIKEREYLEGTGRIDSIKFAEARIKKYTTQLEDLKEECLSEKCLLIGNKCVDPTTHATRPIRPSKKGYATREPIYLNEFVKENL